ncbi:copper transport protein [Modestobacter sp. DSM 44400]|uniref:copper resistance CopC/CopD family protein n=1 Tax=Modestobacter sp. DSM 44400 TaxID=1550230 RepID=UPI0008994CA9|nr:copper resistance protein CopC [Modestobacter sp. DSM 44400]SDY65736.1 copper transport protein [Modestobacter sp. DSM 44400]
MFLLRDSRPVGRRNGRRLAAIGGAAFAILVLLAGPAAAHPTLLTTVPATGSSGPGPVSQVVLAFDEPVTATRDALQVTDVTGQRVPTGPLQHRAGDRQLVLPIRTPLTTGQFQVRWQVTASDGDVVDGSFAFGVGAAAPKAEQVTGWGYLAGTAALRWLLFAALAVAVGGQLGEWLARRATAGASAPALVRAPLRLAALVGFAAAAGLTTLLLPAAGGWSALVHVRPVELVAGEVLAFGLAAAAASVPGLRRVTALPLAAVLVAEGLRAHPEGYSPGWGAALTVVHLGAAALWTGALIHVLRTARAWRSSRARPGWSQLLLLTYAPVALGLYLLVVVTGTVATVLVLRSPADLISTGYGRVLVGKLVLVTAVTVLAVLGRRRIRLREPARADEGGTLPHPGRATGVERSALIAVLAVTALLVSLPAPRPTTTALTLPPPPSGPITAFGSLLGQLSLGATASSGQLQLSLTAPGSDPGEAGHQAEADTHAAVTLRAPGAAPVRIAVRGCGSGCYLATTPWRNGINQVTVTAGAADWHGGTATFDVPWPPVDATPQLRAMVTALRATPTIDLTETLTSDTTGRGYPDHLQIPTDDFLDSEPYGNGAAPVVTALPPRALDGASRIAVAYPAIGVYLSLTLDHDDRPLAETEATPNHLITRTFSYPNP